MKIFVLTNVTYKKPFEDIVYMLLRTSAQCLKTIKTKEKAYINRNVQKRNQAHAKHLL